jgi:hypothetical protein
MKRIHLLSALALSLFLFSTSSCVVKKDNGKHKGWFKNPNNPHNPAHTGKSNGNGNGNGNSGKKAKK